MERETDDSSRGCHENLFKLRGLPGVLVLFALIVLPQLAPATQVLTSRR
jgi:hypothetical protein